jgi:Sec23-binding domain of Sec16
VKDALKLDMHGTSNPVKTNFSFLLTKFAAKFSAVDGPDTHYTLLGANLNSGVVALPQVLLSEVFEYSQSRFFPEGFLHLLPYKLWHAWMLADYGYLDLAEKYILSRRRLIIDTAKQSVPLCKRKRRGRSLSHRR